MPLPNKAALETAALRHSVRYGADKAQVILESVGGSNVVSNIPADRYPEVIKALGAKVES